MFSLAVELKPLPVIVTSVPAGPFNGATEEMLWAFIVPKHAATKMIDLINAFITFYLNARKLISTNSISLQEFYFCVLMRHLRIFLLLILHHITGLQHVSGQSFFVKIPSDSIVNVEYLSDSVRILSANNNILYLDSTGFPTPRPSSISKTFLNNLEITLEDGGVLIAPITFYKHLFSGKSIRHIGKNYVASYDGLFKNRRKFSALTYSNGVIREVGDSVLVAWDGFTVFHKDSIYDFTSYDTIGTLINERRLGFSRDVVVWGDDIFLLTTEGVFKYNIVSQNVLTVYKESNNRIQFWFDEIGVNGLRQSFMIGLGTGRYRIFKDGSYSKLEDLKTTFTYFNEEQNILLFKDRIRDYPEQREMAIANNYHCVFKVRDIYYGASDNGLFAYADRIEPLQLNSIEYNARSFRISQDTVYLGSISGLYKYPFDYLANAIKSNSEDEFEKLNLTLVGFIVLGVLILIGFIVLLVSINQRISDAVKATLPKEVTKSILVEYMSLNIQDVSIAELCHEFNLNQKELYSYFPESSPGAAIKQMRLLKAKELFQEGKSTEIIASETGYSKKYLTQTILPQLKKK